MPDKLKIILEVDDKGTRTVRHFDEETEQAFAKMRQNADRASKSMGGSLDSLKKHWVAYSAAAVAAIMLARKAITSLMSKISEWTKLSMIQQDAEKGLDLALETTGRYTQELSQHFRDLASAIQAETRVGDEATLQVSTLLIQLTKLDREGLDAATKGAIGLATVFKQDVSAAATLVAKAMAGNYGALSRYGIMVEKSMTDEQKRASILEQLSAMYERAKGETDTYAGALAQMKNIIGDLYEKLGDFITKNQAIIRLYKSASEYIKDLTDQLGNWIEENQTLIEQRTEEVLGAILEIAKKLPAQIERVAEAFGKLARAIDKIYTAYEKLTSLPEKGGIWTALLGRPLDKAQIEEDIKWLEDKMGEWDFKIIQRKKSAAEAGGPPPAPPPGGAPPPPPPPGGGGIDTAVMKELAEMGKGVEEAWAGVNRQAAEYGTLVMMDYQWAEEAWEKEKELLTEKEAFLAAGRQAQLAAEWQLYKDVEQGVAKSFKSIEQKHQTMTDNLKNAVAGWASNFSAQLNDMLWNAETTFRDILRAFARMVTQMLIQAYVVKPLLAWMGIPLAKGGVIDQGRLLPYARGGIVDKPIVFPMAGGMGLMGEKGPEAVMPLARTASGDLGVKTAGEPRQRSEVMIILENPVFQDLATQRQVMANIATQIAERVAPGAVVRSYDNDGPIRARVRSRI